MDPVQFRDLVYTHETITPSVQRLTNYQVCVLPLYLLLKLVMLLRRSLRQVDGAAEDRTAHKAKGILKCSEQIFN